MKFKKNIYTPILVIILSVLAVAAIFTSILFQSKNKKSNTDTFFNMDTFISVYGGYDSRDEIKNIFNTAENIFDRHKKDSEVSRLNKEKRISASDKLIKAVNRILELNRKYGNSADITIGAIASLWNINGEYPQIPSESDIKSALKTVGYENVIVNGNVISLKNNCALDFGAAAKGVALDYAKDLLDDKKSEKTIISAGSSSLLLYGDESFSTSIFSPEGDGSEIMGKLNTPAGFISTSGGYNRYAEIDGKRYIHIMDVKTGKPSQTDLTSVTVFCQSGADSDFLSTMIFADGVHNLNKYLNCKEFQILAVDKNKNIYLSEGLDFELTDKSFSIKKLS